MRTARRKGNPLRPPRTQLTVDEYWELWWASEVTVAKSHATQRSYKGVYASNIRPRIGRIKLRELINDPQILEKWRSRLARDKSQSVLEHSHRVLSSMLSAAADEGVIPYNPLMLLALKGGRGRKRVLTRSEPRRTPMAVDPAAWFVVVEYLRRPTRTAVNGGKLRSRCDLLDRERDALIVALGFMAGFRLPSEALGLTGGDVRAGRLHMEGRSSAGEYTPGSKTGPGRDLPIQAELAAEFKRVKRAYADAGRPLGRKDFWISAHRRDIIWTEHQASNWRGRDFKPVTCQVAVDFPQFAELRTATPYSARHTFISCCLQAGISLACIAAWCGTSIQMISETYGRMIRRYEGASSVSLSEQFRTAKVEAVSLLSAQLSTTPTGGSTGPRLGSNPNLRAGGGSKAGSMAQKLPPPRRRKKGGLAGTSAR